MQFIARYADGKPHGRQQEEEEPKPCREREEPGELKSAQSPLDLIDEASMESFPCSDPPSYTTSHV